METRRRVSESLTGRRVSEQSRQNNSRARLGKKRPESTRKAISDGLKKRHQEKGPARSQEGKERHRQIMLEKWQDPEYRKKMSLANATKDNGAGTHLKWYTVLNSEGQSLRVHGNWERRFVEAVTRIGVRCWSFSRKQVIEYEWEGQTCHYGPDFYLPDFDYYVEVKGLYSERDKSKVAAFRQHKTLCLVRGNTLLEIERIVPS